MGRLEEKIQALPPPLQQEVEDFVEFLVAKRGRSRPAAPTLEWAGALKDLRGQYTSVDLQHAISTLRITRP